MLKYSDYIKMCAIRTVDEGMKKEWQHLELRVARVIKQDRVNKVLAAHMDFLFNQGKNVRKD